VAHRLGWVLLVMAGTAATTRAQDTTFQWNLPPRYPQPPVPADNPMSVAKVELGRRLFYDRARAVTGRSSPLRMAEGVPLGRRGQRIRGAA
jgi:hypothetical protein